MELFAIACLHRGCGELNHHTLYTFGNHDELLTTSARRAGCFAKAASTFLTRIREPICLTFT
jgi:hypothetical protein